MIADFRSNATAPNPITVQSTNGTLHFQVLQVSIGGTNYTPFTSTFNVPAGSSVSVVFTRPSNTTATSTTTVTTTTTAATTIYASNQSQNASSYGAKRLNGESIAGVQLKSKKMHLSINGSVLHSIDANFNTNLLTFNITIVNQTSLPQRINSQRAASFVMPSTATDPNVYQYIQINETGVANIDRYVVNATYNFSVPISWAMSHGVNPSSIHFLKYVNGLWVTMPTGYLGSNSTSYLYTAISNSLSSYAVSYTSQNVSMGETAGAVTANLLLTMPAGYNEYFWVAQPEINVQDVNWTIEVNPQSGYSINGGGTGGKANATDIGNSTSLSGNAFSGVDPSAKGLTAMYIEGVGMNVIMANGNVITDAIDGIKSSPQTLSYTVQNNNAFVLLTLGMNDGGDSAGATPTAAWPAGCTPIQNITGSYGRLASQVVCPTATAGTQSVTVTFSSTQGDGIGLAAYQFGPYALTLDDANPTTGTISTDGYTDLPTGSVVNVVGYGEITANPPSGYILNNWTVTNTLNVTIDNPIDNPTNITVMGNDILTANYVAATISTNFIEVGLPNGATWKVVYRGLDGSNTVGTSAATNTIQFKTNAGNFLYSIEDPVIYLGNTYTPNVITANWIAGNNLNIKYAAAPKLSIQFPITFNGVNDNVTANSVPNTDGIEILASGTVEKSAASGTITWNALGLAPGTYTINALDTTSGGLTQRTLVVESDPTSITNAIPITLSFPNISITTSRTLTSDQFAWNFNVLSGVTLNTNGFSIFAINNFTNDGNVVTGNVPNGGAGIVRSTGNPGGSAPSSYGGSGAGGGGNDKGSTNVGAAGGSTQAAGGTAGGFNTAGGSGSTPSSPAVSASNVVTWYNGGVQNFLEGAGGGAGGGTGGGTRTAGGNGGNGGLGIFIEAKNIYAGNIIAAGLDGTAGGTGSGGGGGGGGGSVILVYKGTLSDSSVDTAGGTGGPACSGCANNGGTGGAGQIITYHYTTVQPPIPIIPSPFQQLVGVNALKYQGIEEANMLNTEFFYANGTIVPSWEEDNAINNTVNSLFWVDLKSGFRGNGTITIYMGFASHTTTMMNHITGQAPELSSPFGQYDSGSNVFVIYSNGTDNGLLTTGFNTLTVQDTLHSFGINGATPTFSLSLPIGTSSELFDMYSSVLTPPEQFSWAGLYVGLVRYMLNAVVLVQFQNTGTNLALGTGLELSNSPQQGYTAGSYSPSSLSYDTAAISETTPTGNTLLASSGTATPPTPEYIQATYNDGLIDSSTGASIMQNTYSTSAFSNALTGDYAGVATDAHSTTFQEEVGYFFVHTYPMGGAQPYVSFGPLMTIPPPSPSSTCQISLSNSLIGFGGINPLSYAATANLVVDTNSGGVSANILVDGSNWISGANNFYVANGLWNPTSAGAGVGNALKLDPSGLTDTGIVVPAAGTGKIYFGLGIPGAQPPGGYNANIVLENKC